LVRRGTGRHELLQQRPSGLSPCDGLFNLGDALEGYDTLRCLAESPRHIVPGHDPLVMARYPAVSKELEGIAVRLDVSPRD